MRVDSSCRLILLVLFSVLPAAAMAADIVGSVLRGNAPVGAGVNVELRGVARVLTDAEGRFVFRNVQPGVYELRCGQGRPVQVRINDGINRISCQG